MSNIYTNIAISEEIASDVSIDVNEDLCADSATIEFFWKYFRLTNSSSLQRFGPPVNNQGVPLRIDHVDIVTYEYMYDILKQWFIKYINQSMDSINVLKIETPAGGLYIRNVLPEEHIIHKFVTADLPANTEWNHAAATFEQIPISEFELI